MGYCEICKLNICHLKQHIKRKIHKENLEKLNEENKKKKDEENKKNIQNIRFSN